MSRTSSCWPPELSKGKSIALVTVVAEPRAADAGAGRESAKDKACYAVALPAESRFQGFVRACSMCV